MKDIKNKSRRIKYIKPTRRKKMRFDYFISKKLDVLLFKFAKKFVAKIWVAYDIDIKKIFPIGTF